MIDMKKLKKVVDERQELEILRIEHVCFWIAFWALLISIIVQALFLQVPITQLAAEWIIFMICCVGVIIGCIKKGQWDCYSEPGIKSYVIYSLIGSFVFSILFAAAGYVKWESLRAHPFMFIAVVFILFAFLFVGIFVAMILTGTAVKKRRQKLEKEYSDEDN